MSLQNKNLQKMNRKKCCVTGCGRSQRKNPELSFHSVPKKGASFVERLNYFGNKEKVDRRYVWLKNLNMNPNNDAKCLLVCSAHFNKEDYYLSDYPSIIKKRLKFNAVPTQNIPTLDLKTKDKIKEQKRRVARSNRENVELEPEIHQLKKENDRKTLIDDAIPFVLPETNQWKENSMEGPPELKIMKNETVSNDYELLDIKPSLEDDQLLIEEMKWPTYSTVIEGNMALQNRQEHVQKAQLCEQLPLEDNIRRLSKEKQLISGHKQLKQKTRDVQYKLKVTSSEKFSLEQNDVKFTFENVFLKRDLVTKPSDRWSVNICPELDILIWLKILTKFNDNEKLCPHMLQVTLCKSLNYTITLDGKELLHKRKPKPPKSLSELSNILVYADKLKFCTGGPRLSFYNYDNLSFAEKFRGKWKHVKCDILSDIGNTCTKCFTLFGILEKHKAHLRLG